MRPVPMTESFEAVARDKQMLGSRADVIAALARIVHTVRFPDPAKPNYGVLQGEPELSGDDYFIEFAIEEDNDFVASIAISNCCWFGDDVISMIHRICQETDWRVFDSVSGIFINIQTGEQEDGWHIPQSIAT